MKKLLTLSLAMCLLLTACPFMTVSAYSGFSFYEDFDGYTDTWDAAISGSDFASMTSFSTDGVGSDYGNASQCHGTFQVVADPHPEIGFEDNKVLAMSVPADAVVDYTCSHRVPLVYLFPADVSSGTVTATYRINVSDVASSVQNGMVSSVASVLSNGGSTRWDPNMNCNLFSYYPALGYSIDAEGCKGLADDGWAYGTTVTAKTNTWTYYKVNCTYDEATTEWIVKVYNILDGNTEKLIIDTRSAAGAKLSGIMLLNYRCDLGTNKTVYIDDIDVNISQEMPAINGVSYIKHSQDWDRSFVSRDVSGYSTSYFDGNRFDVDIVRTSTNEHLTRVAGDYVTLIGACSDGTLVTGFQTFVGSPDPIAGEELLVRYRGQEFTHKFINEKVALSNPKFETVAKVGGGYSLNFIGVWRSVEQTSGIAVLAAYKGDRLVAVSSLTSFTGETDQQRIIDGSTLNLSVDLADNTATSAKVMFLSNITDLQALRVNEVLATIQFQ